jgi:hypothetical protein
VLQQFAKFYFEALLRSPLMSPPVYAQPLRPLLSRMSRIFTMSLFQKIRTVVPIEVVIVIAINVVVVVFGYYTVVMWGLFRG